MRLETELAPDVVVRAEVAVHAGLIVNEWITNAAKYAYPDRRGRILVTMERGDEGCRIAVSDDGIGGAGTKQKGSGGYLVPALAEGIGARVEIMQAAGRRCTLILPA